MVFNSAAFVLFCIAIFSIYWIWSRRGVRVQNSVLLLAGCLFYGSWDWKFLALLAVSGTIDYFIARKIEDATSSGTKKRWMLLSLLVNIGVLFYFKYFGFFAESFSSLLQAIGMQSGFITEKIILPLGISYYTFLKFGYILDIWRGKIPAEKNPLNYFTFLLFFPYTLAGPVERAGNMLPQIREKRTLDYAVGVVAFRIILWGYFKKVVIADRLGFIVNPVFDHPDAYSGSAFAVAIVLFHIQLYADFSGYSDIARGVAQLFGLRIINNFDRPFYAPSLRKYWRRWHISVSTWFNEYLFSPLTIETRNWGNFGLYFSVVVTFTAIGFWHGAEWTYLVWGLLMGLLICGEQLLHRKIKLPVVASVIFVNLLIIYCLIWFRAATIEDAAHIHASIFTSWNEGAGITEVIRDVFASASFIVVFCLALIVFLLVDALSLKISPAFFSAPRTIRWLGYYALILIIVFLGVSMNAPAFVYFKF